MADVPATASTIDDAVASGVAARGAIWHRLPEGAVPVGIAIVTALAYAGTLANGFVEWDDHVLIVENEGYRGLGWRQIVWMFTSTTMGHYVPVTWLTHGLDYVLWGMHPAGYHLTNLLIHAANAAVVFYLSRDLLRRATAFLPPLLMLAAAASALFFALHPLRVESVAWVTERRDVLSGLFFFLTLWLYLRAVDAGDRRAYVRLHALAAFAYLLAILSKAMVMTLPVILILLDLYPLRRLGAPGSWLSPAARPVWREKVPYLALGALAAMLGYYAQAINGFFTPAEAVPWTARPSLALHSLWFYFSKTLMPVRLSPLYELPAAIDPLAARFLVPAVIVVGITIATIVLARRWPAGLAVWASYAILVSPVAGLTHSGFQLAHDRYSYLPCVGFALVVGGGMAAVARLARQGLVAPALARLALMAALGLYAGLALLTWQQVETWRDTDALWRNAAEAEPECSLCRYNLGARAFNSGQYALARDEFERLLKARPDRFQVHGPLGIARLSMGEISQAIPHYHRVLARDPNDTEAHNNLGAALHLLGRHRESLREFLWAMRLAPSNGSYHANVGVAYFELGERQQAILHLRRAIELRPDLGHPHFALGTVLLGMGDRDGARRQYEHLRRVDPALASFLGPGLVETW